MFAQKEQTDRSGLPPFLPNLVPSLSDVALAKAELCLGMQCLGGSAAS
jgi:hypothetical protein